MKLLALTFALPLMALSQVAEPAEGKEAAFVACLAEKDPDLIGKIRDAESQEAFLAALKEGVAKCPVDTDGMSMGRLFGALKAHKQEETDA
ncbi:hypothetical protein [Parerythrobacter jejuensis]|uniref:Uncharacterized protein n=1 Tax=Parerythrobacter jejuensis TaxID=795812 RepID=A0A845ASK5_9SPHN|nr:hypothetical protein [Parerythrobacter jejuensis]MXP32459.1 hypothetical protein [Parerythrobacter jejuensis]